MDKRRLIEPTNVVRWFVAFLLIFLQLVILALVIATFENGGRAAYFIMETAGLFIALTVIGAHKNYSYKLSWTVFLITLPFMAIIMYLFFGEQRFLKKTTKKIDDIKVKMNINGQQDQELINNIPDKRLLLDINHIFEKSGYPVYYGKNLKYYPLGEDYFRDMIEDLKQAENFILMEIYIVGMGQLFDEVTEVLKQKAQDGVEVYFVYDYMGSMLRLSKSAIDDLVKSGINVLSFNDKVSEAYNFFNYRTHRKMIVIDGKIGYTGGINMADEYINVGSKYGHWKDMGVKFEGPATNNFIFSFFKFWNISKKNYVEAKNYINTRENEEVAENSYIIPFTETPTNRWPLAAQTYMRIITNAKRYVYISTPYLIIDEEMTTALKIAARSGVDVRITIPGIADKKFVYLTSKAHIEELIHAGVKIYTYDPGFNHGKVIVSDDKYSVIGSVNFDFRSLLWNLESALYTYDRKLAKEIVTDFNQMYEKSTCINESHLNSLNFFSRAGYGILKLFGPLL